VKLSSNISQEGHSKHKANDSIRSFTVLYFNDGYLPAILGVALLQSAENGVSAVVTFQEPRSTG
jgi:hypothetical protein